MQGINITDDKHTEETRHFERYPVEVPARVELLRSRRKDKVLFLRTCNLSATGAFFPEWESIPVGTPINVEYYLFFENQDAVELAYDMVITKTTGKVVRSDRFGTAARFAEDYQMKTYRFLLSGVNGQKIDKELDRKR